ncbi:hypothetical protein G6F63_015320 [Rhizopus arrhizus]|nr:hypothetical protein G6F63_015320 [Rhizopus arrhizus]
MLLDRQRPDGAGAGFVAPARALRPNLAVIMLTAKGTLSDKVEGLDVGADDYLVKPVAIEELMARIRSGGRPAAAAAAPAGAGAAGAGNAAGAHGHPQCAGSGGIRL